MASGAKPTKCPICDAPAEARAQNAAFPFCSARCKTVDLGKWLNEDYRVPTDDAPTEGDAPAGSKTGRDMRN